MPVYQNVPCSRGQNRSFQCATTEKIAKAVAASLARKVAEKTGQEEAKSYFLNIKGPELLNKYVGETERHIRLIFQRAREASSGRSTASGMPDRRRTRSITSSTCAVSASEADRPAFELLRAGLERLIVGRGGAVVAPPAGTDFDARTMEAVDVHPTDDTSADRTVAELLRPGLVVGEALDVAPEPPPELPDELLELLSDELPEEPEPTGLAGELDMNLDVRHSGASVSPGAGGRG